MQVNLGSHSNFGASVAVEYDGNYAIIGAPGDDIGGSPDQGSASIFQRSGTTWSQMTTFSASDGDEYDGFGTSVSIDGDYALVGAIYGDVGVNDYQGSAYIFFRSGANWNEQAKLVASDGEFSDYFGCSVSI